MALPLYYEYRTVEWEYILTPSTFTKRELTEQERGLNIYGGPIKPFFIRERLRNEYAALQFIRTRTSIPVPKVLEFTEICGSLSLTLERVDGVMLHDLEGDRRSQAFKNIDSYVKKSILPQLYCLQSPRLGSLIGELFPPNRVLAIDKRRVWPKRYANVGEKFVFCHNDLAQHNIFVDAKVLQVTSVIDWEYSGYFPREVDLPLWLQPASDWGPTDKTEAEHIREIMLRSGPNNLITFWLLQILNQIHMISSVALRLLG